MSQTFEEFLSSQGFRITRPLTPNGEIHRYDSSAKKGKTCWAILFPDGKGGVWGDWRDGDGSHYWDLQGREYKSIAPEERKIIEAQRQAAKNRQLIHAEELAAQNLAEWDQIADVTTSCAYLNAKQVGNYGLKIDAQGNAYCPARDITGKFWNYQNISSDPKLFKPGKMGGCFHVIDGNHDQTVIASGYATAASIHEATGLRTIVCFGDTNVIVVAKNLKDAGWKSLIVAADNDSETSKSGNKIAQKAYDELGIQSVIPDTPGDFNDHAVAGKGIYRYFFHTTPAFSFGELMADKTPMPEDIIAPRVLTEGGMLVFGGAPKVGKSDFMLSWLVHMAAGLPFMGMTPPRPLKIFYLQAEVQYHYLRERVKAVDIQQQYLGSVERNLFITPQVRILLDEDGVKTVGNTIRQCFGIDTPDIIVIDPIANVYDQESENDNAQMMKFLSQRVEALRAYANEHTGFMLVHHTKKIAKEELVKDPFQMFSGASSLRRYYTTGMLMFRPDEEVSECVLTYEVRNGARIKNINVDKVDGRWSIIQDAYSRISKAGDDARAIEERKRKVAVLIESLRIESSRDIKHTIRSFSAFMAGKSGLGAQRTITEILNQMIAQGDIWDEVIEGERNRILFAPESEIEPIYSVLG